MRAGTLRHRVTLQQAETVRDAYGGTSSQFVDVATVWGSLEAVSGREFFSAQQVQSEVTHKLTLRFCPDVTADMRVVFGAKVFGIEAVLPDNRQTRLVLMLKEASSEQ